MSEFLAEPRRGDSERDVSEPVEMIDDGTIEDGPLPWWSGFVWFPLLLVALLFFAGIIYALWSALF